MQKSFAYFALWILLTGIRVGWSRLFFLVLLISFCFSRFVDLSFKFVFEIGVSFCSFVSGYWLFKNVFLFYTLLSLFSINFGRFILIMDGWFKKKFFFLFNLVSTKLQVAFYRFRKLKIIFEIWPVKVGAYNSTLWEAQTKTAKKDYFTKILSSPRFFEINTSNFQEMFLDIFRKFCRKRFKKFLKKL